MLFLLCALTSVLALALIIVFIMMRGAPALAAIGVWTFISESIWAPSADWYGILPMIVASVISTLGAILMGAPIGVMSALFITQIAPPRVGEIVRFAIDLLAAVPSVVYGFFGLVTIVPALDRLSGGYGGNSLLAGIIILGMMVLPTIISVSVASLNAVPGEYREASLAMGETVPGTAFRVMLPAARSGVSAAVVLGVGRAVGETMAVTLVMGNTPRLPDFARLGLAAFLRPARTLTGNIAIEMGYASGLHEGALFATAVVLLLFIVIINMALHVIRAKAGESG